MRQLFTNRFPVMGLMMPVAICEAELGLNSSTINTLFPAFKRNHASIEPAMPCPTIMKSTRMILKTASVVMLIFAVRQNYGLTSRLHPSAACPPQRARQARNLDCLQRRSEEHTSELQS